MATKGKLLDKAQEVIEVTKEHITEGVSAPETVKVSTGVPYHNHEYQNISNTYLTYLKEKSSLSLFDTTLSTEVRERQETFLKVATAILDYRTTNGIIVN